MGDAIGQSILKSGYSVYVNESNEERQDWIASERPDIKLVTIDHLLEQCVIIFLAIKPQQFSKLSESIQNRFKAHQCVVSMMAGVTIDTCSESIGHEIVARIMPNTAAALNQGVTGIFFPSTISLNHQTALTEICELFGITVVVKNEDDIHSITALSGSGPAFFYRMVQSFIDFAKEQNLDEDVAKKLVIQTLIGAGSMLTKVDNPRQLIDQVTSPNGTTFAGLQAMNSGDFDKLMYNVLDQARNRSIELSKEV